jgi:hypothetical protein
MYPGQYAHFQSYNKAARIDIRNDEKFMKNNWGKTLGKSPALLPGQARWAKNMTAKRAIIRLTESMAAELKECDRVYEQPLTVDRLIKMW